jgi:hypothetical protein
MNEYAAIVLMMNNYLHDVATALLISSGYVIWAVWRCLVVDAGEEVCRYFIRIYSGVTKLARASFILILVFGIPRVLYYKEFEWSNMAGRGQVPALMVKHVVAFTLVALGIVLWMKVRKVVIEMETRLATEVR